MFFVALLELYSCNSINDLQCFGSGDDKEGIP